MTSTSVLPKANSQCIAVSQFKEFVHNVPVSAPPNWVRMMRASYDIGVWKLKSINK